MAKNRSELRRRRKTKHLERREKVRFAFLLFVVIFIGSFFIWVFERQHNPDLTSLWDAIWLVFVTLATVGYGDVYPVTTEGRIADILTMLVGIGLLGAFVTSIARGYVEKLERRARGVEVAFKFSDHFLVCGWNERGEYLLSMLMEFVGNKIYPIVVLSSNSERPFEDDNIYWVKGNHAIPDELKSVGIEKAKGVILLADESRGSTRKDIDAYTVLSALTVRSICPEINITAEILQPENRAYLEMTGVNEILDSNKIGGYMLAKSAVTFGFIETVSEFVERSLEKNAYRIVVDDSMAKLSAWELFSKACGEDPGASVLLKRGGEIGALKKNEPLRENDVLIVISESRPQCSHTQLGF